MISCGLPNEDNPRSFLNEDGVPNEGFTGFNTMNQKKRGKSSDITNEEGKGNRNGWDSSRGVEVFGRRRDCDVVGFDAKDIQAGENTNVVDR